MPADEKECFVIMPFGMKRIPDGGGREYDFDKVYRVIIQPAIEALGMVAHRADQTLSSGPIHTDMFRALRDRSLVLADLSLLNPNVFYEVGIRHVLKRRGTVLICGHMPGEKLNLPFDIALSRVVPYEYDGMRLDWEVVEKVRVSLRATLEAARDVVDSPLHSLLTDVSIDGPDEGRSDLSGRSRGNQREFQKIVAAHWMQNASTESAHGKQLDRLLTTERYRGDAFAVAAIGLYCLSLTESRRGGRKPALPDIANDVADQLRLVEQYEIADQLYGKLHKAKKLRARELSHYASVHSEVSVSSQQTEEAIALAEKAIALARRQRNGAALADVAYCTFFKAGLFEWSGRRWKSPGRVSEAMTLMDAVIKTWYEAGPPPNDVDDLARVHLKTMYLLRRSARDRGRPDRERHGDKVLDLKGHDADKESRSWLTWYQAIVYADRGNSDSAQRLASQQSLIDGQDPVDIRSRRHSLIRRFINDNADVHGNPAALAKLTQHLRS